MSVAVAAEKEASLGARHVRLEELYAHTTTVVEKLTAALKEARFEAPPTNIINQETQL